MSAFKPLPRGSRTPDYQRISSTGREIRNRQERREDSAGRAPDRERARRLIETQPSRCWRVARVARHLDLSKKRVYQLVEEGRLEAVRLGPRGMRILVDSIDTYLKELVRRERDRLGRPSD